MSVDKTVTAMQSILERFAERDARSHSVFTNIRRQAWDILLWRLENEPENIDNPTLVRLVLASAQIEFNKAETARPRTTNVLMFVQGAEGLPPDRRRQVLEEGIKAAELAGMDAAPIRERLNQLEEAKDEDEFR